MNQGLGDTPAPRQFTRADYAALRAWLQGVPAADIAARYLVVGADSDDPPDPRSVQRELLARRDALVQRAHQHGAPHWAAALTAELRGSGAAVDRALRAVIALEALGTPKPKLTHAVRLWFAPALARRLERASLATVGELVAHCEARGRGWWRSVPRVGAKAAAAVLAWLQASEKALGVSLGTHVASADLVALAELVPLAPGGRPAPFEALRLSSDLDGSAGSNRAPAERSMLGARNDYEAILAWLARWNGSRHTFRAYRKEAERFLAWAVVERGKALSSLVHEDCIAYRDFLADPQPAARWCGPMTSRFSPAWRPFQGPLAPASANHALTVLRSLCEFLTRQRYLYANPWDGVPDRVRTTPRLQIEKALSLEAWAGLTAWLELMCAAPGAARWRTVRAVVVLLRDSGLRIDEACRAVGAQLRPIAKGEAQTLWGELSIVGKGSRERSVPISASAMRALRAHWDDRGIEAELVPPGPLLAPPTSARLPPRAQRRHEAGASGYTPSGIHRLLASIEPALAAADVPQELRVRAHALRHSFASHSTERDVPIDVLQAILGHASPATTSVYNQARRERRLREVAKLYADEG